MSVDEIDESTIVKYLEKDMENSEMLRVDRWMAQSTDNMKKFNEIRSKWLNRKEDKIIAEEEDQPRMKAKAAKTSSGEKLEPVKTSNKSRALILLLAVGLAVLGAALAFFFGASKG